MELPFAIYVIDTETTGLDSSSHEIIELSIFRLNDETQKTWCIKPKNYASISTDALRVNGHKLEDLQWKTAYGKETYRELARVLPEVENYFMEDGQDASGRILCGQNVGYDLGFLKAVWKDANSPETFPFGDRPKMLDTLQLALFLDIVGNKKEQYYNLGSLVERYGVKKERAHRADGDVRMTKDVFLAQMKIVQKAINKG